MSSFTIVLVPFHSTDRVQDPLTVEAASFNFGGDFVTFSDSAQNRVFAVRTSSVLYIAKN